MLRNLMFLCHTKSYIVLIRFQKRAKHQLQPSQEAVKVPPKLIYDDERSYLLRMVLSVQSWFNTCNKNNAKMQRTIPELHLN